MRILRSLSAGLLLSAYLILEYGIQFSRWYGANAPLFAFHIGVHSINPAVADAMGGDAYGPAIFILGCLGVGIFVGSTLYAWVEWLFWGIFVTVVTGLEDAIKAMASKLRQRRAATA